MKLIFGLLLLGAIFVVGLVATGIDTGVPRIDAAIASWIDLTGDTVEGLLAPTQDAPASAEGAPASAETVR